MTDKPILSPADEALHAFDAANNVEPARTIAERIARKCPQVAYWSLDDVGSLIDDIAHAIEDARDLGRRRAAVLPAAQATPAAGIPVDLMPPNSDQQAYLDNLAKQAAKPVDLSQVIGGPQAAPAHPHQIDDDDGWDAVGRNPGSWAAPAPIGEEEALAAFEAAYEKAYDAGEIEDAIERGHAAGVRAVLALIRPQSDGWNEAIERCAAFPEQAARARIVGSRRTNQTDRHVAKVLMAVAKRIRALKRPSPAQAGEEADQRSSAAVAFLRRLDELDTDYDYFNRPHGGWIRAQIAILIGRDPSPPETGGKT